MAVPRAQVQGAASTTTQVKGCGLTAEKAELGDRSAKEDQDLSESSDPVLSL